MSVQDMPSSVRAYLVRSSTPVPNEKVMLFLQGLKDDPPERPQMQDSASEVGGVAAPGALDYTATSAHRAPSHRGSVAQRRQSATDTDDLHYTDEAGEPQERVEVARSRQPSVASRSVRVETVPPPVTQTPIINKHMSLDTAASPARHISMGSGPSWGNFGPLHENVRESGSTFGHVERIENTPARAVQKPLPPSVMGTPAAVKLTLQAPTDPEHSRAPSRISVRSAAPPQATSPPPPGPTYHIQEIPLVHVAPDQRPFTEADLIGRAPSPSGTPRADTIPLHAAESPLSPKGKPASAASYAQSRRQSPPARSYAGSMHPSMMPLPMSPRSAVGSPQVITTTYEYPPVYAPSRRAPSLAPSQAASQHPPRSPVAKSPTNYSVQVKSVIHGRTPSQYEPSARGGAAPSIAPSAPALHPVTAHERSKYGGSRYGGESQTSAIAPALHPLTNRAPSAVPTSRSRVASPFHGPGSTYQGFPDEGAPRAPSRHAISPSPSHLRNPPSMTASQMLGYPMQSDVQGDLAIVRSAAQSPDDLDREEQRIIDDVLLRTPRTSYTVTPAALANDPELRHFHDEDLCVLLHEADKEDVHDVVKRAVRKAIRGRLKRLGLKYDNDGIKQFRDVHNFAMHSQATPVIVQAPPPTDDNPPAWAQSMMQMIQQTRADVDNLGQKIENASRNVTDMGDERSEGTARHESRNMRATVTDITGDGEYGRTPFTETVPIHTEYQTEGSVLQPLGTEHGYGDYGPRGSIHHHDGSAHDHDHRLERDEEDDAVDTLGPLRSVGDRTPPNQDGGARHALRDFVRSDVGSLGDQIYEEQLYKLRIKPPKTDATHQTWDVTQAGGSEYIPEIPDSELGHQMPRPMPFDPQRKASPPLPPVPAETGSNASNVGDAQWPVALPTWQPPPPTPWQHIFQRLLNWATAWPMSELDKALNSTTRGHQVDEIALTIWTTQTYKRYVRLRLTDSPPGVIEKLFVPPIMADAISSAVFSGRHGDASTMLRDLWHPFGLEGTPRLIIVLAKNRRRENQWVVHRFDLDDNTLSTYDTSIEKTAPDARPLGWWFSIRTAFPSGRAPANGHLYQNNVRMPRPMQLLIDNSVAAAAIWRNMITNHPAQRAIDLERLRDLINIEVKNLRTRKELGKLTAALTPPTWEQVVNV